MPEEQAFERLGDKGEEIKNYKPDAPLSSSVGSIEDLQIDVHKLVTGIRSTTYAISSITRKHHAQCQLKNLKYKNNL